MIKLVIDGTCKGCPWQDIRLMGTSARCIHDYLCKYVTYTDFSWDDWEREQIRAEKMKAARMAGRENNEVD